MTDQQLGCLLLRSAACSALVRRRPKMGDTYHMSVLFLGIRQPQNYTRQRHGCMRTELHLMASSSGQRE